MTEKRKPEKNKEEIITFKADKSLVNAMRGISNRSEFIRSAILGALEGTCPLCRGAGFLTASQLKHWNSFSENHFVTKCESCNELHLVCNTDINKDCNHHG